MTTSPPAVAVRLTSKSIPPLFVRSDTRTSRTDRTNPLVMSQRSEDILSLESLNTRFLRFATE
jgi:hypothetical protein